MIEFLEISNCRRLRSWSKNFTSGVTVISGGNGLGKTTLLESIFLLTTGYSFRARNLETLISNGESELILRGVFNIHSKNTTRAISVSKEKILAKKDARNLRSPSQFFGELLALLIEPQDNELVRGAPEVRRKYLDESLGSSSPLHLELLKKYKKILTQRNFFLKEFREKKSWDASVYLALTSHLAKLAASVWSERFKLADALALKIPEFYARVSSSKNLICCKYQTSVSRDKNFETQFLEKAEANYDAERRLGTTLQGPHRDDFILFNESRDLRNFGSQGECRTAAIAMRFAALELARARRQNSILLLDDIFAELDTKRREAVSELIREKETQVFIATPRIEDLPFTPDDQIFLE